MKSVERWKGIELEWKVKKREGKETEAMDGGRERLEGVKDRLEVGWVDGRNED